MVDTFFFGLQFIGLFVLLHWALIHDKPDDSGAESGLLAMRPTAPDTTQTKPMAPAGPRRAGNRVGRAGRSRR